MKQYKSQILLLLIVVVVLIAGILQLCDKAYATGYCHIYCNCANVNCNESEKPQNGGDRCCNITCQGSPDFTCWKYCCACVDWDGPPSIVR